jgi:hypothetical protein
VSSTKTEKIGFVYRLTKLNSDAIYAQVIAWDKEMGHLVRIAKLDSDSSDLRYGTLKNGELFPPVFVGLDAAVRAKEWILVAKNEIDAETIPPFKATNQSPPDLDGSGWYIRDGGKSRFVGQINSDQKNFETYQIWGYKILEDRIVEALDLKRG